MLLFYINSILMFYPKICFRKQGIAYPKKGCISRPDPILLLNLVVVIGEIEFVVYDDSRFYGVKLSKNNYQRLTVESGLWLAFRGISVENMLLNLASIEHNTNESKNVDMCGFNYDWNET